VHATIEEKHFYPATKNTRTEELLQEAVEEHLSVKRSIADLLEISPEDARFDAKLAVLKEQVEHHVEEEEGELFPKVKKMLGEDELEDLGVVMEDMAEGLKAAGAPRESVPAETGSAAPLE
jgi:hemerythrin superfamily protein